MFHEAWAGHTLAPHMMAPMQDMNHSGELKPCAPIAPLQASSECVRAAARHHFRKALASYQDYHML